MYLAQTNQQLNQSLTVQADPQIVEEAWSAIGEAQRQEEALRVRAEYAVAQTRAEAEQYAAEADHHAEARVLQARLECSAFQAQAQTAVHGNAAIA